MKRPYRLVVEIDDDDRARLRAGARIIVAKSSGTADPSLVWLTCPPAARTVVEWEELYGVYASEIPARDDSVPAILDLVYPAQAGAVYPFTSSGFAAPREAAIPAGHYDVRNESQTAYSFGLVQQAFVDGRPVIAPVHGVTLPPGFTADFTRRAQACVWLAFAPDGGAGTGVAPPAAAFLAFGAERSARCRYDDATASFRVVPAELSNDG